MTNYKIVRLIDNTAIKNDMALWFNSKWGIPTDKYIESMERSLIQNTAVPQWYAVMIDNRIIAGLGVIENDFHDRPDLTPNVCAVYVEKEYRGKGIAGQMLEFVCDDMKKLGINTLYLVTDHTSFYEKYGWKFMCNVNGADGITRLYVHKDN